MIKATMRQCMIISDPKNPVLFDGEVIFDPALPLEIKFVFVDKHGAVEWLVGRQLVVDGLETSLMTGIGDFKIRSTAKRLICQLRDAGTGYIATVSLPREQVVFVVEEAEAECPLLGSHVDALLTDELIADFFGGRA